MSTFTKTYCSQCGCEFGPGEHGFSSRADHKKIVKRGGPGRGQGRKPVKQGEETVTVSLRMTLVQREKLRELGGAKWVRGMIENRLDKS